MNALERERFKKRQRDEAAQTAAALVDRALHPWLYQTEDIPAVWNHSDLETVDRNK